MKEKENIFKNRPAGLASSVTMDVVILLYPCLPPAHSNWAHDLGYNIYVAERWVRGLSGHVFSFGSDIVGSLEQMTTTY